jgi:hypothetical protein
VSAARTIASAPLCISQVLASSIRVAVSPPAVLATESRVSSVRSDRNHETRAHWPGVENYWGA